MKVMTSHLIDLISRSRKSSGLVTPLLEFLAAGQANRIEALWPAPHEGFFALPTARRHAVAILLSGLGGKISMSADRLVSFIEHQKDKAIAELLVGPNHSAGLMKMLTKCGEQLWPEDDYALLLRLFCSENANQVLRHMESVTQAALMPMTILPDALRTARIVSLMPHLSAAYDIALAWEIIGRLKGQSGMKSADHRWNRAKNHRSLFSMVASDLIPDQPVAFFDAPELPAPFSRVTTTRALRHMALEFKNCLEDFAWSVAKGKMAVYVRRGEPNAALALLWNVDGWRLAEAEKTDNEELDEAPLRDIVSTLEAAGVRTGSSVEGLHNRLTRMSEASEIIAYGDDNNVRTFVERLDLGDLWQ